MKNLVYKTKGTCSKEIHIAVDSDNIIREMKFINGCDGNSKGVASLCIGRKIDDVINRLEGITCLNKSTSCPDQVAKALRTFK
ncbi:MAG: TIGR03905 family TSCPD domain-containing protein [Sphaerochaetaceae bacterium]|nr:TIGR03905 family TSCPD domain-containing protein [Sphaerochaetaceae bacterium]MDC7238346.1 TIGR03905 family TSCPD domain-containing protein [Sphaerochaetaceae bacterium]MDC7250517.1 TIGR03905 family TSCPD domain-containing protein [Sphaerochaetaceae bacterium]